jgi:hypothetical protein
MGSEATQATGQDSPLTAVQYLLSSQQRYQSGVLAEGSQQPKKEGSITLLQNYHGLGLYFKKISF